ncbi:MAG: hypothetical protein HY746_04135 [Elusimicrobia bacterium]|nr:hypothetical protein [Elusimicrobiota bacterium]
MKLEKKSVLMLTALAFLILTTIPAALFHNAIKKYFTFLGLWDTGAIKPSKISVLPYMHARDSRLPEIPQPEFVFVRFSIKAPKADEVKISADFNKWNPDSLALVRKDRDTWQTIVPLTPGKYKYLYWVDGELMLDPKNPDTDLHNDKKVSLLTVTAKKK